jgi:hypothetical protein
MGHNGFSLLSAALVLLRKTNARAMVTPIKINNKIIITILNILNVVGLLPVTTTSVPGAGAAVGIPGAAATDGYGEGLYN